MIEENILQELVKKFDFLKDKAKVVRVRRIATECDQKDFDKILDYAVKDLKFAVLCTITGLDEGASLAFIYHLAREDGIMFNLKFSVPKDKPVIKTVTDRFAAADIYEREIVDLLGARVSGLAKGRRYPLSDDWPEGDFPLRKDWKAPASRSGNKESKADA